VLLASASAEVAPSAPRTVLDMALCPVLLELRVAGLARVRNNSDDFVFRRGVFATLRGTFLVDLRLLRLPQPFRPRSGQQGRRDRRARRELRCLELHKVGVWVLRVACWEPGAEALGSLTLPLKTRQRGHRHFSDI
jgi:hypothetical protein